MNTNTAIAQPGHNNPPSEIDILKQKLSDKYEPDLVVARKLIQDVKDLNIVKVENDEQSGQLSDIIKDISTSIKKVEALHKNEKEFYLQGGRVVDSFFKTPAEVLKRTKDYVQNFITDYLVKKDLEEKQRLAAEAKKKQEEEKKQLEAAAALESVGMTEAADKSLNQAVIASQHAHKAETASQVKTTSAATVRGTSSAAGLRKRWVGEMSSRAALQNDAAKLFPFFTQDSIDKAINAFVNAGNRELAGVRIYEKADASIR